MEKSEYSRDVEFKRLARDVLATIAINEIDQTPETRREFVESYNRILAWCEANPDFLQSLDFITPLSERTEPKNGREK